MSPPRFADLGKPCNDVFTKYYNYNLFQLNSSQTTCGEVGVKTSATHNFDDATFNGSLEVTLKPWCGLAYVTRWLTNGYIFNGISIKDRLTPGLKLGVDTNWSPDTGDKTAILNGQYVNDLTNLEFDVAAGTDKPDYPATGSVVVGYEGFLAGARGELNSNGLVNSKVALGHSVGDTQAFMSVEDTGPDGAKFRGSIFQRITNRLESGIVFGWGGKEEEGAKGGNKLIGVAGHYLVDPCSSIRGKYTNDGQVGIGYDSRVRHGVTVAVAANINLMNFYEGGHKIGFGVNFEQ